LPPPTLLCGELTPEHVHLNADDRGWLARQCRAVLHAAADVSFRSSPDGEPWRTNVGGTEALLRLAESLNIPEWHHVSTAFVCGRRGGTVREDDLECQQPFHNPYEQSKRAAEVLLRQARGPRVTVYRPGVIVGDSRTGATYSYEGLYRFLALAARLAGSGPSRSRRPLPLRLPATGDEPCHLVPVDWVARAIAALSGAPRHHGLTYHLTARHPTPSRDIQEIAVEELHLEGVELVGPTGLTEPSRLEELFLDGLRDHWPYLTTTTTFCDRNTAAALPHLPPPPVDRPALRRLIRFAVAHHWGRPPSGPETERATDSFCAHYLEHTFPRLARESPLAHAVGLEVVVGFDVRGPGGGQWSCRWDGGEFRGVSRGLAPGAAVVYHTDAATFAAVARGQCAPQQAFFDRRIEVTGDLETALKLVTLFEQFLRETEASVAPHEEAVDATHS
jgi:nucleoside-diphosphate-sugar epimerase